MKEGFDINIVLQVPLYLSEINELFLIVLLILLLEFTNQKEGQENYMNKVWNLLEIPVIRIEENRLRKLESQPALKWWVENEGGFTATRF